LQDESAVERIGGKEKDGKTGHIKRFGKTECRNQKGGLSKAKVGKERKRSGKKKSSLFFR